MKFIAVILTIYIFYLISVPCADDIDGCEIQKNDLYGHNHSSRNHDDTHMCSPFCICSCCHVNVVFVNFEIAVEPVEVLHADKPVEYSSSFISDFFPSFWQPPKLS